MNAGALDVLHDAGNQNVFAVADCIDFKFYAHHVFVDEDRIFDSLRKDNAHIFFYVRFIERDNHILSAKNVRRTQENRIADFFRRMERLVFGKNGFAFRAADFQFFAELFKSLAVFCKVD